LHIFLVAWLAYYQIISSAPFHLASVSRMRLSTGSTDGRSTVCGASAARDTRKKKGNGLASGLPFGRQPRGIGRAKNRSIPRTPGNEASSGSAASDGRFELPAIRGDSRLWVPPPAAAPVDGGESDDDDERDGASSVPGGKVSHDDRALRSIGCRERQFIDGMLTRLRSLGIGATRGDYLLCVGTVLRSLFEWERTFFDSLASGEEGEEQAAMRVDPLWAGVERLLLRGRAKDAIGYAPDGPMALSLIKNTVLDVLLDMGIDPIRVDVAGGREGKTNGWNAPGCCQCSLFATL
jgi:hypothetical protein